MRKYQVICVSFDGEYKRETPEFDTIEKASQYGNDLGSKWYFYPFQFIVSGETIRKAGYGLTHFEGRRIKTVQRIFKKLSEKPEMEGANVEEFYMNL